MKQRGVVFALLCVLALPASVWGASVGAVANVSNDGPADNGDNLDAFHCIACLLHKRWTEP
jgi:hypothetical protein